MSTSPLRLKEQSAERQGLRDSSGGRSGSAVRDATERARQTSYGRLADPNHS